MKWNWWPLVWRSTIDEVYRDFRMVVAYKNSEIAVLRSKLNRVEVELADLRNAVRRTAP
jgi:hypothetical protein